MACLIAVPSKQGKALCKAYACRLPNQRLKRVLLPDDLQHLTCDLTGQEAYSSTYKKTRCSAGSCLCCNLMLTLNGTGLPNRETKHCVICTP